MLLMLLMMMLMLLLILLLLMMMMKMMMMSLLLLRQLPRMLVIGLHSKSIVGGRAGGNPVDELRRTYKN